MPFLRGTRYRNYGLVRPYIHLNGSDNPSCLIGSDASVDDLTDNAFTAEIVLRLHTLGATAGQFFGKGNWYFRAEAPNGITSYIGTDGTAAASYSGPGDIARDGAVIHLAMTYNDGGDRYIRLYKNGVEIPSYFTYQAATGSVLTDAAINLRIGRQSAAALLLLHADVWWARISDTALTSFAYIGKDPPPVDGNTVALWRIDEGQGTTLDNAEGTAANDCTITTDVLWKRG